jgi:hypothetical protein
MEWNAIQSPDDLTQWAKEKAASPAALAAYYKCMVHLGEHIEIVVNDSKLEHPVTFETGTSEVRFKDGSKVDCYLVSFTLEDTGENFDYLFTMLLGTDLYSDVKYADPDVPVITSMKQ